jgi:pimeloyl-ACP methyl ester carboxylesterase
VDGLLLASPAGLTSLRLTPRVLGSTLPWLLRPSARSSARLLEMMTGSVNLPDAASLVEWTTLIGQTTRSTGAPGPLPAAALSQWRGHKVVVVVGQHDVFFPPARIADAAGNHWGVPVEVAPTAGHLLTHEDPERLARALERLEANCL